MSFIMLKKVIYDLFQELMNDIKELWKIYYERQCYGSFTLQEMDLGTDSDSDPIPVVNSWDLNLNLTMQCENFCLCSHWV